MDRVKRQAECYYIRKPVWAVIMIDEESGTISIVSDYGNFGYRWGARSNHGCNSLKHFLISMSHFDYVTDKFSYELPQWFDCDASVKEIKLRIVDMRRKQDLSQEDARELWMQLEDLECMQNHNEFTERLFNNGMAEKLYDNDYHAIPITMDVKPALRHFMQRVWPEFISMLKEELNETSPITA